MQPFNLAHIYKEIGYVFRDPSLLEEVFTHTSYVNEHRGVNSYQRLEFLGDSVVNCVAAKYLYQTMPRADEGHLTKIRAKAVSTDALAAITDRMGLIVYLKVNTGSKSEEVCQSPKVRADLFEAITGGIFWEAGFEEAEKFVLRELKPLLDSVLKEGNPTDAKSRLLEGAAKRGLPPPVFDTHREADGFRSVVSLRGMIVGEGRGQNKKTAERDAAQRALDSGALSDR